MNAKGVLSAIVCAFIAAGCGGGGGGSASSQPPATQPAPQVSYASPPTYVQGQAISPLVPTVTGIATTLSAVSALPADRSIYDGTGVCYGTPITCAPDGD